MKTTSIFTPSIKVAAIISAFLLMLITPTQQLFAQGAWKLSASKDNVIKVLGSSNVHDWVETSTKLVSDADFVAAPGAEPTALNSLNFSVEAKTLKSEHEAMDSRTYKAINADKFPKITFKLSSATITPGAAGKFTIKATGTLTIAGKSNVITLLVNGEANADGSITCTGQEKIKLTDYGIEPPSFMLGAMKVANNLTIQFTLNYKK